MLKELLAAIASGRNQRMSELARELNSSEGMVAQMMMDLERMGYIAHDSGLPAECPVCHGGCSACALRSSSATVAGQTWELTAKGRRRLQPASAPLATE
jgi:hypothetical protein